MSYKAGVIGAAGFAGVELTRILIQHPGFELVAATSDSLAGKPIAEAYPAFAGATDLAFTSHAETDFDACDVVFLAVPHTAAMGVAPDLLSRGACVIDLSADFRLKDPAVYEQWYGTPHTAPDLIKQAAFGIPELFRDDLVAACERRLAGGSALVGCAGCYPTVTSLAAAPMLRSSFAAKDALVVVDAVSGVTGAGKKATDRTHFCFANDNLEAYGVGTHRHTPEIEQILGICGRLVFTPHLAPLNRGILSTVTIPLAAEAALPTSEELVDLYRSFYSGSPLVTVLDAGDLPRTASVAGTTRAQIGVAVNERARCVVSVGAIDNLGKGAAGQAVQCANIVFDFDETTGIDSVAMPI